MEYIRTAEDANIIIDAYFGERRLRYLDDDDDADIRDDFILMTKCFRNFFNHKIDNIYSMTAMQLYTLLSDVCHFGIGFVTHDCNYTNDLGWGEFWKDEYGVLLLHENNVQIVNELLARKRTLRGE